MIKTHNGKTESSERQDTGMAKDYLLKEVEFRLMPDAQEYETSGAS